ncbi:HTH domain-containing protein [Microbacterium amylolyticum]
MLGILLRRPGWVTAGSLADQLGVTPRSVRSYVTAINAQSPGVHAIDSGPQGYRATPAATGMIRTVSGGNGGHRTSGSQTSSACSSMNRTVSTSMTPHRDSS